MNCCASKIATEAEAHGLISRLEIRSYHLGGLTFEVTTETTAQECILQAVNSMHMSKELVYF